MGDMSTKDHMVHDALTDAFDDIHMGITAENIAKKFNISREEQDKFAYGSQQKAIAAQDKGVFKDEITPVSCSLPQSPSHTHTHTHTHAYTHTQCERLVVLPLSPTHSRNHSCGSAAVTLTNNQEVLLLA